MFNSSFTEWSILKYFSYCFSLPSTYYHFIPFVLVNVPFVLPLCLYILRRGLQRWRSRANISHTDFFTYNMVVVQLIGISGSCLLIMNWFLLSDMVTTIGMYMILVTYTAIIIFQIFTCLEHYFAVVHPVIYLSLKSQTWSLIRNVGCGYVWLQCAIQPLYLSQMNDFHTFSLVNLIGYSICLLIVLYCNICVRRALVRPRPGDAAKGNNSKQKAVNTITAITVTLLVKLFGDVFCTLSFMILADVANTDKEYDESCALYFSVIWFTLPSSLVLPLLFLHRNEKMLCCKTNK